MKSYVHARLTRRDQTILEQLKKSTGHSESELIRAGLRLMLKDVVRQPSALELAGSSAGKFKNGPKDLSTNKKHLDGFGE